METNNDILKLGISRTQVILLQVKEQMRLAVQWQQ